MTRSGIQNSVPDVDDLIMAVRGHRVILSPDLAALYGVPTKVDVLQRLMRILDPPPGPPDWATATRKLANPTTGLAPASAPGASPATTAPANPASLCSWRIFSEPEFVCSLAQGLVPRLTPAG
jgi:hypothetical protein